jgi:hypothetical protein
MARNGFQKEAAFFDLLAAQATDPLVRQRLLQVSDHYRPLPHEEFSGDLSNRAHWAFRAEECRTLAEQFRTPDCREQL